MFRTQLAYLPSAFFAFVTLLICHQAAIAQVHIAPTGIYLNNNTTSAQITVHNSSDQPQELNIELLYGYPDIDENGKVYLKLFDNIPDGAPSALEFARVYPRHLILPPNEQQIIRFVVRPPSHLKPGEYWARPAISSTPVQQKEEAGVQTISTKFNLTQRTILSLNYRHGRVNTGIEIEDISASVSEDGQVSLKASIQRNGNSAYLGEAILSVSKNGQEVHQQKHEIAVYSDQVRIFDINKKLEPGSYQITLTLDSEARAGNNEDILPTTKAIGSTAVTIHE